MDHLSPPISDQKQPKQRREKILDAWLTTLIRKSVCHVEDCFSESSEQKEKKRIPSTVDNVTLGAAERGEFSAVSRLSSDSSAYYGYSQNYRGGSFYAASIASWNSHACLLSKPPGSIEGPLRNFPAYNCKNKKGGSTKWFLGRKCPCFGKKSVLVEEKLLEPTTPSALYTKKPNSRSVDPSVAENRMKSQKSSITGDDAVKRPEQVIPNFRWFSSENHFESNIRSHHHHHHHHHHHQMLGSFNDGTGFSFPVLNQSCKMQVLKGLPTSPLALEDPHPLKVFQPPDESISRKSLAVRQSDLASHSGDRGGFSLPGNLTSRITTTDEDVASDISSDLFEIESWSTQTIMSYLASHSSGGGGFKRDGRGFAFPASPTSQITAAVATEEDDDDDVASDGSSDLFEIESLSTQTTSYLASHSSFYRNLPSSFANPASPVSRVTAATDDDDAASDASSDLMEIECCLYNTQTTSSSASIPGGAMECCYEELPSDASIDDWSVTTTTETEAEGASCISNLSVSGSDEIEDDVGPHPVMKCAHAHHGELPRAVGGGPPLPLISRMKQQQQHHHHHHHASGEISRTKYNGRSAVNNRPPMAESSRIARLSLAFAM